MHGSLLKTLHTLDWRAGCSIKLLTLSISTYEYLNIYTRSTLKVLSTDIPSNGVFQESSQCSDNKYSCKAKHNNSGNHHRMFMSRRNYTMLTATNKYHPLVVVLVSAMWLIKTSTIPHHYLWWRRRHLNILKWPLSADIPADKLHNGSTFICWKLHCCQVHQHDALHPQQASIQCCTNSTQNDMILRLKVSNELLQMAGRRADIS